METIRHHLNRISTSDVGTGATRLFRSESVWTRVVFLILVIIVFILLLRVLTSLITWFFAPASSPYLVKGLKDAKKLQCRVEEDFYIKKLDPVYSHDIFTVEPTRKEMVWHDNKMTRDQTKI